MLSSHVGDAKAQTLSGEKLDAVLAGMGAKAPEPDLDAILAGMSGSKGETDFDAILSGMGDKPESSNSGLDGVLASMNIANTLNYLENAYSYTPHLRNPLVNGFGVGEKKESYPLIPGNAMLPVYGRVTSNFGFRPSFGRMHKGIDIAVHVGDTIVASMDGRVERISFDPNGYGVFVCIDHGNGFKTRYAHLSQTLVSQGMNVYAGEAIALGGNTGNSTAPHLHFETRVNDVAIDPTRFFDFSYSYGVGRMRNLSGLDAVNPKYMSYPGQVDDSLGGPGVVNSTLTNRGTYVVKVGDSIASVAKRNGISVSSLCRLNMLSSSDKLQPGRMLKLR